MTTKMDHTYVLTLIGEVEEDDENDVMADILLAKNMAGIPFKNGEPKQKVKNLQLEHNVCQNNNTTFVSVNITNSDSKQALLAIEQCLNQSPGKIIIVYGGHSLEDGSLCFKDDTLLTKNDLENFFEKRATPSGHFIFNTCYSHHYNAGRFGLITTYGVSNPEKTNGQVPIGGILSMRHDQDLDMFQEYALKIIDNVFSTCGSKEDVNVHVGEWENIWRAKSKPWAYDKNKVSPFNQDGIIVFNAGRGICSLVKLGDKHIMFDAGEKFIEGGAKFLANHVSKIDHWIISHSDDDHIGGLRWLLSQPHRPDIRKVYITYDPTKDIQPKTRSANKAKETIALIQGGNIELQPFDEQSQLQIIYDDGSIKVTGFLPTKQVRDEYNTWLYKNNETTSSITNEGSICTLIEVADKKLITTGDVHAKDLLVGLNFLVNNGKLVKKDGKICFDYMEVPHHGAKSNYCNDCTIAKFYNSISCKHFLVSTNGKRFNHPDEEVIDGIIAAINDCKIYLTRVVQVKDNQKDKVETNICQDGYYLLDWEKLSV